MYVVLLLLLCQDFDQLGTADWADLAKPWMTSEEQTLYEQLSAGERRLFRGYFVARRLPQSQSWPETGLFLPAFHHPKPHGDIRDQLLFALGEPKQVQAQAANPNIPARWSYGDTQFVFEPLPGGRVRLAGQSRPAWETVKKGLIKQPQLRYDFYARSFGRTRLPDDVTFTNVAVANVYALPAVSGDQVRINLPIPAAFKAYLRETKARPIQEMELLVTLKRPGALLPEQADVRHGSRRLDLLEEAYLSFDVFLPEGYWEADLKVYSGFLNRGLRAAMPIAVTPRTLPRISDPIICHQWTPAGIEQFGGNHLVVADQFYKPAAVFQPNVPARVLVASPFDDTRLLLQEPKGARYLEGGQRHGDWWIFPLPALEDGFRLLSLGFPAEGNVIALGAYGTFTAPEDPTPLEFSQEGHPNYLSLEQLEIKAPGTPALLFVNDQALLASKNGIFPWRGLDWGKTARLRFAYTRDGKQLQREFKMRRRGVFEQIAVTPQYVVAGTKRLDGRIEKTDLTVRVLNQPVKIVKSTPLTDIPQLWGVVVNDPLLKSASWPMIKARLAIWLKNHVGEDDLVYVVHNGQRPEMILAPTQHKPLAEAALDALLPNSRNTSYFTVQYLIEALTHLSLHRTRPHQVLLLTAGLTDEIKQMEDLIPRLRGTGLQLYNLEFPFAFEGENPTGRENRGERALDEMATRAEARKRHREGLKDHFLEDSDGVPVASYTFGRKKSTLKDRETGIRETAFREAFNNQLATLTAGLAFSGKVAEGGAGLNRLFADLSAWQETLVHLELSAPYLDSDMVSLNAGEGFSASWTLVAWRPQTGKTP